MMAGNGSAFRGLAVTALLLHIMVTALRLMLSQRDLYSTQGIKTIVKLRPIPPRADLGKSFPNFSHGVIGIRCTSNSPRSFPRSFRTCTYMHARYLGVSYFGFVFDFFISFGFSRFVSFVHLLNLFLECRLFLNDFFF